VPTATLSKRDVTKTPTREVGRAAGKEITVETKTNSDAKNSANRRNAKESTGPNDTSSTRHNAVKHGLLSAGITELDDVDGYRDTLGRLQERYFDELEAFLVERIALCMVRLRRTTRLEAELVTIILHPPTHGGLGLLESLEDFVIDPGQPARIDSQGVEILSRYQRYESANENKLYRAMNQLERIRRIQQGEHLPAPVAVDVAFHSKGLDVDSDGTIPIESTRKGPEVCIEGIRADEALEQPPDVGGSTATNTELE
jgi:hypothetical protein